MPAKRTALALLLVAFMVGIVGGALLSGGGGPGGTSVAQASAADLREPTPTPTPKPKPQPRGLTAVAVHEGNGRIVISGVQKPAKAGTRVTVQRKEGSGWVDFPAGSTVGADGRYSLWLQTSRKGDMSFRVVEAGDSRDASNPVTVKV